MTKHLQSLPFRIADCEARIADLEADLAAVTRQRDALLAFAQDFKAFVLRDDYEAMSDEEYAQCMNALGDKAWAALAMARDA